MSIPIFCCAALALASGAMADIKVRAYNSSNALISSLSQDNISSWASISIPIASTGAVKIFIWDGNGSVSGANVPDEAIGDVTLSVTGTPSTPIYVVIGNPNNLASTLPLPATPSDAIEPSAPTRTYATGVGQIVASTTALHDKLVLIGQVGGNVGTNSAGTASKHIYVGKVRRLVFTGTLMGDVRGEFDNLGGTATLANGDWSVGRVDGGTMDSGARIQADSFGSIGHVGFTTLSGYVSSVGGSIYTVDVSEISVSLSLRTSPRRI